MFGKAKLTTIFLDHPREALPVRITGDGALSTGGVADGRMLPVLILDADARPDIREFTKMHRHGGPGDVKVQWGQLPDYEDTVMLILSFLRPVELKVIVAFELHRHHGSLVEQILAMHGLYIQAGTEGDRLKNTMDQPRVLVEVPDTGFRRTWDKLYFQFTVKKLRAAGLDRRQAKVGAREAIEQLRNFGQFRMPSR
jgi:hypothetical protein